MKAKTQKRRGAASLTAIAALGIATVVAVPAGIATKSHESRQPVQAIDMLDSTHLADKVELLDEKDLVQTVDLISPDDIVTTVDLIDEKDIAGLTPGQTIKLPHATPAGEITLDNGDVVPVFELGPGEEEAVIYDSPNGDDVLDKAVSISLSDVTVGVLFDQVGGAAGVKIEVGSIKNAVISAKFDEASLKSVLDSLAKILDVKWTRVSEREIKFG